MCNSIVYNEIRWQYRTCCLVQTMTADLGTDEVKSRSQSSLRTTHKLVSNVKDPTLHDVFTNVFTTPAKD